jgi:hypothetical protein
VVDESGSGPDSQNRRRRRGGKVFSMGGIEVSLEAETPSPRTKSRAMAVPFQIGGQSSIIRALWCGGRYSAAAGKIVYLQE